MINKIKLELTNKQVLMLLCALNSQHNYAIQINKEFLINNALGKKQPKYVELWLEETNKEIIEMFEIKQQIEKQTGFELS